MRFLRPPSPTKEEFSHAVKAGKDARYNFILLGAARMDRSLEALRVALRDAKPSVSCQKEWSAVVTRAPPRTRRTLGLAG